jgi:UDPglucose 6-dehydrogenase
MDEIRSLVTVHKDPYSAMEYAHAIAVLTEWDEFKTYDWQKVYNSMLKPAFIFDGRNIVDKNQLDPIGFEIYSIGKGI